MSGLILWQQLCWLQAHPENCHGGNHWIENLSALALGGLQFDGPKARNMHRSAMRILQQELRSQVLRDGGHEERSASYHLLMLDRLSELALALQDTNGHLPQWLTDAIEAMAQWTRQISLENGVMPRFNDSAADAAPPVDLVLSRAAASTRNSSLSTHSSTPHAVVTDLPDTGWTLLHPGYGWQLFFKCGVPCPPHLPPHVHSDQLSFDLCHQASWILSEAGTSIYGNSTSRFYERSGSAHNVLQLGIEDSAGVINWIEPVDVWGGFRAGRKSKPRDRSCGVSPEGSFFAAGSHNG